jgi:hypothetical protein
LVQIRAVCPFRPQLVHFCGRRFFGGSDSALIISNSVFGVGVGLDEERRRERIESASRREKLRHRTEPVG